MKNILFIISLLTSVLVYSQSNLKIDGNIQSENNSKLIALDIYLFDHKNQLIKSTITQDGNFEFDELEKGNYYIQISSGESAQIEESFILDENKKISIIYTAQFKTLQEVLVTGKKRNVTIENGNITIDLASSALDNLPTTTDLFSKLPFVRVDANGEGLSFIGKGIPLLYIDNQRVDFTTLASLSVDDIKSVEVIRNPSIKYEAEGRAVIKVNLKKSKKEGSQLNLSETAMFQKRFSNYFGANFQQRKNKTEWKFNAAYNQIDHWESNGFDYSVPTENIRSNYIIKSITKRPQTIFGGSFYQEINENDYITLSINANFRPDKGENNTITNYSQDNETNFIKTLNQQDRKRATINSIFNYNKKIEKLDATIFTGFQFKRESDNVDYNFYNDVNNSGYEFSQFRTQSYAGNVYSGRIDIEKKIAESYLIELGGSFTKAETKTDNSTDYRNVQPTDYFKYNFKENNIATYLNLGVDAEKWQIKGGLRMETTKANGFNEIENRMQIARDYIDWFPNAEVSFTQNDEYSYTLNFRKSITRPSYGDLSSGGLYGSPYVEYEGNPNMVPTYSNTLSLSMNLKKWSLNASIYSSKNPMGYTLVYDESRNISTFSIVNFEKELGASLGLDFPFQWKKWSAQNSISLNYDKTEDELAILKTSTPYIYLSTMNTYNLNKYFTFLLDGSFVTKRVEGLYENNAICLVNLGITSSISDFDFTVRYNDVFKQMDYIQKMSYNKMISTGTFYGNTPTISFAMKYNFGKLRKSNFKESNVNETSNRL